MTEFCMLPIKFITLTAGLFFLATMLSLVLFLYRCINMRKLKICLPHGLFFIVMFLFLAYITPAERRTLECNIPWLICVVIIIIAFAVSILGIVREYKRNIKSLSPSSIKQALDNLKTGICFADETGRLILINHIMGELVYSVFKSYPQTLAEVRFSLDKAEALNEPEFYRFPNDKIYRFRFDKLNGQDLAGYVQVTAQDMTELYLGNEQLRIDNERLQKTNEEMTVMLRRLADRIREKETLDMKMRVHDNIGISLITISQIINGGEADMQTQLDLLQNAVSYFSNESIATLTVDAAVSKATSIGVKVIINGDIPSSPEAQAIITSAINECVTNCVKHAEGDKVFVNFNEDNILTITNNGKKPTGEIREGGGLSSLRKKTEATGGSMVLKYSPCFSLTITLPKQ